MQADHQEVFLAHGSLFISVWAWAGTLTFGPGQNSAKEFTNNLCTCQCIKDTFAVTSVDILPHDRLRKVCTCS